MLKDSQFKDDVGAALKRASEKVRRRAAVENRPIVFWKDGKVQKVVPKIENPNK